MSRSFSKKKDCVSEKIFASFSNWHYSYNYSEPSFI